jgi:hypothetical protein
VHYPSKTGNAAANEALETGADAEDETGAAGILAGLAGETAAGAGRGDIRRKG